ncbi:DUF624 domain-containing protein [Devosia sp. Root105]|uniref:DUF624 domain-containing protein n=1 Tax=Devosia sp. Root105 TaxID=1736423 RepID=UPI0006F1E3A1|nr:DUF624 domain-containing protein [Devosia sp. Root105]KQV08880.1 hypothetical protein ASC68_00700 [Devosia sp. Root105]
MATLFSQDSALMRGLSLVADVIVLNLLFVATSIPLFTLGASLTALNFTAMRLATGECNSVSADYFRSFQRNFRQATVIWLLLLALVGVLAAWYVVVTNLTFGPLAELLLLAVWYALAFNFAAAALFVFPYLASFDGRTRDVLRNARLLSWKHPFTGLAALGLIALSVIITIFYPQFTGYGLFWFFVGFAGIATINGRLFAGVFSKYIAAAASAST